MEPGYPRLRGVDLPPVCLVRPLCGLSPLARGGRASGSPITGSSWVIPACAGWTAEGGQV